jgi:hypothetical protein
MTTAAPTELFASQERRFDRRALLIGAGAALGGLLALPLVRRAMRMTAEVFVAANQRYDGPLEQTAIEVILQL